MTFTPVKVLTFDVVDAVTDRFITTMRMPVDPLFKLNLQEILNFIYSKRPTLRYQKIIIEL